MRNQTTATVFEGVQLVVGDQVQEVDLEAVSNGWSGLTLFLSMGGRGFSIRFPATRLARHFMYTVQRNLQDSIFGRYFSEKAYREDLKNGGSPLVPGPRSPGGRGKKVTKKKIAKKVTKKIIKKVTKKTP